MSCPEKKMSEPIIRVEHLGKRYRIGVQNRRAETWRKAIASAAVSPFNYIRTMMRPPTEEETLWALRDVSFEVHQGETLGIVGRNGAGKSTLLKILSRITEPSEGRATLHGRVGSLLEVGTGFHPELTGRENVFMNGTILGMRRYEIEQRFDEIVDFSGIEKFIDTPVKRYSSGMGVRLAFAVAAHLQPEILIVDEVLAVGDRQFQKKCLGKMEDIASEGRTVLFVSHNMQAIRTLCTRTIVLNYGQVIADGATADSLPTYYDTMKRMNIDADASKHDPKKRRGNGAVRFSHIRIEDTKGNETYYHAMGSRIRFVMRYQVMEPINELYFAMYLKSGTDSEILAGTTQLISDKPLEPGYQGEFILDFPNPPLRPHEYPLLFALADSEMTSYDIVDDITDTLVILTEKDFKDLGFHPIVRSGYFTLESKIQDKHELSSTIPSLASQP